MNGKEITGTISLEYGTYETLFYKPVAKSNILLSGKNGMARIINAKYVVTKWINEHQSDLENPYCKLTIVFNLKSGDFKIEIFKRYGQFRHRAYWGAMGNLKYEEAWINDTAGIVSYWNRVCTRINRFDVMFYKRKDTHESSKNV